MSEKPEKSQEPKYAQLTRLAVVYFRAPVNFGGEEKESVSVPSKADLERGQRASNAVDAVLPGFLDADGTVGLAKENPNFVAGGVVLLKKRHNLHTSKREQICTFVPWSNVRSITYGE